jgi:hypothetical protein
MDRWKPGSSPDLLRKVDERDRFALDYAERLAVPSL